MVLSVTPSGGPRIASLRELVALRGRQASDYETYTFLEDGERIESRLTCANLESRARRLAIWLAATTSPEDRVLLLLPPGLNFVTAFFGCTSAARVAVPAAPPANLRQRRSCARLEAIIASASPTAVITVGVYLPVLAALSFRGAVLNLDEPLEPVDFAEWPDAEPEATTPAMLQYTSGSTAEPRGVILSHGNLLHNSEAIRRRFQHTHESRGVIWLPPYHDMGLIGGVLQPLYAGFAVTLMSPLHFIQRPLRWLEAVSRYRATTSGGPNFAYELCCERITAEERANLDLSSWDLAFVGAEPVRAATLERFTQQFAPAGFRSQAFYPCYGLAEATLLVSGPDKGTGYAVEPMRDDVDDRNGKAATVVSCGSCLEDELVIVADPQTGRLCDVGSVGEIWIHGPSVAQGYWNNSVATATTFQAALPSGDGPYLRTGDLGYLRDGQLYIAGRCKDLIILAGVNHYPQDFEQTAAAAHTGLNSGACAAFSVLVENEERLIIMAEVRRDAERAGESTLREIATRIRAAISQTHQVGVHDVCLIRTATMPKTPSGKLQRNLCRKQYLNGELTSLLSRRTGTAETRETRKSATKADAIAKRSARRWAYAMVLTPPLGLLAAIVLSWGHGVGAIDLALLVGMYVATVIGVEVGMHRHFSHRAFQAHPAVRAALGIFGSMAAQGPVLFWVSTHRRHHAFSDRPGDPHSPYYDEHGTPLGRNLLHAHVGWLFRAEGADMASYAPDVLRDRLAFAIHRQYTFWVAMGLLLPAALGGWLSQSWYGALTGLLWGGLVRVFLVHHATWSVNSLCHVAGSRAHPTRDLSTNNAWLLLPSLGGSWHNNHHAYPAAAHNAHHWWQLDPSGWLISLLSKLGLAWNVRTTGEAVAQPKRTDLTEPSVAPSTSLPESLDLEPQPLRG